MVDKQISVLIADDQDIVRSRIKGKLSQFAEIEIVADVPTGSDAIRLTGSLLPHVVLMDLRLPGMDGITTTQKIIANTPEVSVIMLTAPSTNDDIFAAFAAGAKGYCLKEVSAKQLYLAIKSVMSGAFWLDAESADRVLRATIFPVPETREERHIELSQRERDVLLLVVDGSTNSEIANELKLSVETVKTHMRHIMEKLCVSDRTQAAVKALRNGML